MDDIGRRCDVAVGQLRDMHQPVLLDADIGIKQDGLVHISQLADRYVASPADVVHLGQHVEVRVTGIDTVRNRIALSMRKNG